MVQTLVKKKSSSEDDEFPDQLFEADDVPQILSQIKLRLTPKKAQELASLDVYRRQRPKKPALLAFLTNIIVQNLWHGGKVGIANLDFDYLTADNKVVRKVLVNGGHTCKVHVDNNFTTENNVLMEFRCKTPAALGLLYNQFDCNESSRSVEDRCLALLDMMPDMEKWNKSSVNKCSSAIAVMVHGFAYRSATKVVDRINLLKSPEYYKHGVFIRDLVYDTEGGITRNRWLAQAQAVLSVAAETHMISQKDAAEFWTDVRTGAGLSAGSPQLTLNKFLLQSSKGGTKQTLYITNVRCRQAWNAFRNGETLNRFSGRMPPDFPTLI